MNFEDFTHELTLLRQRQVSLPEIKISPSKTKSLNKGPTDEQDMGYYSEDPPVTNILSKNYLKDSDDE